MGNAIEGLPNEWLPAGNKRLLDAMHKHVDPDSYDGASSCRCLIGQVERSDEVRNSPDYSITKTVCQAVATVYNVDHNTVVEIYGAVAIDYYRHSLKRSLKLAAKILGVVAPKTEAPQ